MNPFFGTRKKNIELGIMLIVAMVLALVLNLDNAILFTFGFIWNWVASHDLNYLFAHRRYRWSTLKMVFNLQGLIERPFLRMPQFVRILVRCLPAGIFWAAVIYFVESNLPWWATFMGSLFFELIQFRTRTEPVPPETIP